MGFAQIAKLYLRGSLCNETLKKLSVEQKDELEKIVNIVMDDPNLTQCKVEFCNALARTIKNEYDDRDVGEQDYRIAIMRAAVAALCGWANKPPTLKALTDPIQRKKWFQTWAFNYLRQILRENKIPTIHKSKMVKLPALDTALYEVKNIIQATIETVHDLSYKRSLKSDLENMKIIEKDTSYELYFDHWIYPIMIVTELKKLSAMYLTHGVEITQTETGIMIRSTSDQTSLVTIRQSTETPIRPQSFDHTNKDGEDGGDQLEMKVWSYTQKGDLPMEEQETLDRLRERIPEDTKPILDIFMEDLRPNEFINKYGAGSPKVVHVAEFLNKSPREVKRHLNIIKVQCMAMQLGH